MKTIIIDDERNSREILDSILKEYCEGVEVVGEAESVTSGIQVINNLQPDLIFLDIEMPGGDGFKILEAFEEANFLTCFVTGYEQYAIKAIKHGAFDYLLKPIDIDDLVIAVEKAKKILNEQSQKQNQSLIISDGQRMWVVKQEDIIHIKAEDNYSILYLDNDEKIISSDSLNHYEGMLEEHGFFRSHKSHIINFKAVASVGKGRASTIKLKNGDTVALAARRKKSFYDLLKFFL